MGASVWVCHGMCGGQRTTNWSESVLSFNHRGLMDQIQVTRLDSNYLSSLNCLGAPKHSVFLNDSLAGPLVEIGKDCLLLVRLKVQHSKSCSLNLDKV